MTKTYFFVGSLNILNPKPLHPKPETYYIRVCRQSLVKGSLSHWILFLRYSDQVSTESQKPLFFRLGPRSRIQNPGKKDPNRYAHSGNTQ